MTAEFVGGIVFAVMIAFFGYKLWKNKQESKSSTSAGGGKSRPPTQQK